MATIAAYREGFWGNFCTLFTAQPRIRINVFCFCCYGGRIPALLTLHPMALTLPIHGKDFFLPTPSSPEPPAATAAAGGLRRARDKNFAGHGRMGAPHPPFGNGTHQCREGLHLPCLPQGFLKDRVGSAIQDGTHTQHPQKENSHKTGKHEEVSPLLRYRV